MEDGIIFMQMGFHQKGPLHGMGPKIQIFIMAQGEKESFPPFYTSAFEWTDRASRNSKTVLKGKGGKKPAECVMKDKKGHTHILYLFHCFSLPHFPFSCLSFVLYMHDRYVQILACS